jgi:cytidylate kinase
MRLAEDSLLTDRRVTEWYLREKGAREQARGTTGTTPRVQPVITISRAFGSGGHAIGERVARELGDNWQVWDREIIEAVSQSAEATTEMVEALDEHTRSWIEEMVYAIFAKPMMEIFAYRRHAAQVLLALAQQGHKVIIGRGANFVLSEALNVRLRASEAYRVQDTMRRENIGHEQAVRQVHHVDAERAEFVRAVFQRRIDDPDAYDMILSTDALGVEASVAAIVAAARVMFNL